MGRHISKRSEFHGPGDAATIASHIPGVAVETIRRYLKHGILMRKIPAKRFLRSFSFPRLLADV